MSFPFETTVGGLAANPGRFEIAYVPDDNYLAASIDTVNDERNKVEWLPVEAILPGDLMTIEAGGREFGPFSVRRMIVLRWVVPS